MSVIIDLCILAIVAWCTIRHYKLGLACSILGFAKYALAFVLAGVLRSPLVALLHNAGSELSDAVAGVIVYVVIFAAVIAVSGFIIDRLKNIDIPVFTRFDKLLGLALGIFIGLFAVSFAATAVFTVLELAASISQNESIMNVYNDSYVFKFLKDVSLFEFIRSRI